MLSQLSLFRPSMNVTKDLKREMAMVAARSGLSREQIVDGMNELAGRYGVCLVKGSGKLNIATLDKWLNEEEPQRLPSVKALPVFCAVVRNTSPLQVMLAPLGAMVIGEQDMKLLEWAKAYHKAKAARRTMRKLEVEIE